MLTSDPSTSAQDEAAVFQAALAVVLRHEGGLVDDPADPGGLTNFGISLAAFPELGADGIRALTAERAGEIYREHYWAPFRWRELPAPLAVKAFDAAVNMGGRHAIECLQRACRSVHAPAPSRAGPELSSKGAGGGALGTITDDGALGDLTVSAVNALPSGQLLAAFRSELAGRYRTLAAVNPSEAKFLKGWLARAYE